MTDRERVALERGLRAAVLAGDETAWRTWYDAHDAGLRRYIQWRAGGIGDLAEDTVQETWLTAVRRIRHFDPHEGAFSAWVTGIAGFVLKNHLRKHRRAIAKRRVLVEVPARIASGSANERSLRIACALAELPPRYERVLRAKYLDGHSVNAIAELWNESSKAIESLLTRARDQFRNAYQRLEQADG